MKRSFAVWCTARFGRFGDEDEWRGEEGEEEVDVVALVTIS